MLDPENPTDATEQDGGSVAPTEQAPAADKPAPRKRAVRKTAAPTPTDAATGDVEAAGGDGPTTAAPAKKAAARRPRKTAAAAAAPADAAADTTAETPAEPTGGQAPLFQPPAVKTTVRKRATRKAAPPAEPPSEQTTEQTVAAAESADEPSAPAKKATAKRTTKKSAAAKADSAQASEASETTDESAGDQEQKPAKKKSGKKKSEKSETPSAPDAQDAGQATTEAAEDSDQAPKKKSGKKKSGKKKTDVDGESATAAGETESAGPESGAGHRDEQAPESSSGSEETDDADDSEDSGDGSGARRRPRRRGGRRRRRGGGGGEGGDASAESDDAAGSEGADTSESGDGSADDQSGDDQSGDENGQGSGSRRRRSRRRRGGGGGGNGDGERRSRNPEDEITALSGSTRLEAKKQRRREGREAGRRRAPIVSEAEFLARRESVERTMVVRQREDLTQIGVLEDKVLVEHYVSRESQTSMIGNVYLGRVQNVLPSMEAAFIDIGKGRNAVLYAGEVNWKALGAKDGQPRTIESVLSPGQPVLVQVSKDPIGHKGARLTSQVSLPGRFLVYVPDGTTSGISRKLPEGERGRLKKLLKEIVPDSAGVIVRTAAEGASEEELTKDVERLTARWSDIEEKVKAGGGKGGAPQLLYGEPDLTLKVVRDLFTEDFSRLVVQGQDAWELVDGYVSHVAPELRERLEHYQPDDSDGVDLFAAHRVDEQIAKGLDRKVWLPSGGSLIIDRTEAMTVVDVNTGKFTGSGGNLEETVTKNNLEAAEEIVRQLRLRDIGGIVVVDFIDMVLESNRDLVLRRLVECLGRDRTRHQVAEVTSLGLVQMTRKRIGTGLLEAFSEDCTHCKGRGLTVHEHPIEPSTKREDDSRRGGGRRGRGNGGNGGSQNGNGGGSQNRNGGSSSNGSNGSHAPSPADVAAIARAENADKAPLDEQQEVAEAPKGVPTETTAETATETTADTPAVPVAPSEDTPSAPVDPAPAVVTSGRRRTARRAAGPPVDAPDVPAAPEEPGAPEGTDEVSLDPGPADAPVTEDETVPLEAADADGDTGDTGDTENAENAEDEDSVLSVPVKRKSGRRR